MTYGCLDRRSKAHVDLGLERLRLVKSKERPGKAGRDEVARSTMCLEQKKGCHHFVTSSHSLMPVRLLRQHAVTLCRLSVPTPSFLQLHSFCVDFGARFSLILFLPTRAPVPRRVIPTFPFVYKVRKLPAGRPSSPLPAV